MPPYPLEYDHVPNPIPSPDNPRAQLFEDVGCGLVVLVLLLIIFWAFTQYGGFPEPPH